MIDEVDSYATVHLPALTFNMIIIQLLVMIITTITQSVVILILAISINDK